jgi:hypothetical protein
MPQAHPVALARKQGKPCGRGCVRRVTVQCARQLRFKVVCAGKSSTGSDLWLRCPPPETMNRVDAQFPLDLLARQPADTARRYAEGDPVIRDAFDHGKVLYEQGH